MKILKFYRRAFSKPLPRWLFGYQFALISVSLIILFLTNWPMLHKQVIIGLLASPVLIGIPLIEMCLLIREERLGQFLSLLQKTAPILVLCFIPTLLILPRVETLWGCLVVGLIGGLFGSWGRRMIDLGLFGDPSEYADLV